MLSLRSSDEIAYDGSNNTCRMDLFADTAADLTGVTTFDSIVLLAGSSALDISTGDLYRMKSDGTWILQPGTGAFSNVYTKAEIDSMLLTYYTKAEADELFEWITATITTDTPPLTFTADGSPLISWSMLGNGSQQGTPTPDNPVIPEFVGTLYNTDWTIPISCGGETTPVYLGQTQTVRRIKKKVLDGTETTWTSGTVQGRTSFSWKTGYQNPNGANVLCTHYRSEYAVREGVCFITSNNVSFIDSNFQSLDDFKNFLAAQYANETPVTVWYVIATPQTAIVNEPLCKIGTYADELHSTDAAVTIPTVKGSNTLTVNTTLQPSEITITGKIRES